MNEKVILGDCVIEMGNLEEESMDLVIADPHISRLSAKNGITYGEPKRITLNGATNGLQKCIVFYGMEGRFICLAIFGCSLF